MCLVGVFAFSVTEAPNEETTSSPPSPGTRLSQEDLKNLAQASRFCDFGVAVLTCPEGFLQTAKQGTLSSPSNPYVQVPKYC